MAIVSDVMDRLVAIVEAQTPDTPGYFGAANFIHIDRVYDSADLYDEGDPTRFFRIDLTGTRAPTGWMGAQGSPVMVEQEFSLELVYRQGANAWQHLKIIAEDVDRLAWNLERNSNYNASTTSISRIIVGGYAVVNDEQPNGIALVSMPVTVTYQPEYTA